MLNIGLVVKHGRELQFFLKRISIAFYGSVGEHTITKGGLELVAFPL